jgi:hypothetical protein
MLGTRREQVQRQGAKEKLYDGVTQEEREEKV